MVLNLLVLCRLEDRWALDIKPLSSVVWQPGTEGAIQGQGGIAGPSRTTGTPARLNDAGDAGDAGQDAEDSDEAQRVGPANYPCVLGYNTHFETEVELNLHYTNQRCAQRLTLQTRDVETMCLTCKATMRGSIVERYESKIHGVHAHVCTKRRCTIA